MSVELDTLKTAVENNTTVVESAKVLLVGLKTKLDEAIAALPDRTQLVELSDKLGTTTQGLSEAVSQNTPASP